LFPSLIHGTPFPTCYRWESIVSLVYADLIPSPLIYHTSSNVSEWIELKSAIFNTLDKCDEATSIIIKVLEASSVKIAHVPDHVLGALKKYCHFSLGTITPLVVSSACRDVQFSLTLQWECKMKLLRLAFFPPFPHCQC